MRKNILTRLEQENSQGRIKFMNLILERDTIQKIWGIHNEITQMVKKKYLKDNEESAEFTARKNYFLIIKEKIKEGYKIIYSEFCE